MGIGGESQRRFRSVYMRRMQMVFKLLKHIDNLMPNGLGGLCRLSEKLLGPLLGDEQRKE